MADLSPMRQYWSDYDDDALLRLAARTLADLRSDDARRQVGAREQLQELQAELRRRGVWRDKDKPSDGSQTTTTDPTNASR
jgi:hypothetical protein